SLGTRGAAGKPASARTVAGDRVRRAGSRPNPGVEMAGEGRLLLEPVTSPRLFRSLAEEADDLHRSAHVALTRQPHGFALPALPDERDRLGEPELVRKFLDARSSGQVLAAGDGHDCARRAVS